MIEYETYIVLGYHFEDSELVEYIMQDYYGERKDRKLDYIIDVMSGQYIVVGRIIDSISIKYDADVKKIIMPMDYEFDEIEELIKEELGVWPGKPELLFFAHAW